MGDALLDYIRSALPEEVARHLENHLSSLENGDFLKLFQHPLVQVLLGHEQDDSTTNVRRQDFPVWSDYIFHRLSLLLGKRKTTGDTEANDTPAFRQHLLFIVGLAALYAFMQSNVTGPPLPFSCASTLLPKEIVANGCALKSLRGELIVSLGVDGEAAYKLTPNVELLCLADAIMSCPPIVKNVPTVRWAQLRVSFMHQRLLSEISPKLQTSIYDDLAFLETLIMSSSDRFSRDARVQFLLERATIHTHHGFDKKARADIDQATKEQNFDFALTGLLGKRTKFQENDISQLVVLARSANPGTSTNGDAVKESDNVPAVNAESVLRTASYTTTSSRPHNLNLNDDTLLESISFSETAKAPAIQDSSALPDSLTSLDPANQPMLRPLDSIILLSLASSITNTSPAHGLTREETLPYATRVLDGGSSNWQIYTQALLVRSRIEGYRSRTMERGLLQLQALVDQVIVETTSPKPSSSNSTTDGAPTSTFLPRPKQSESAAVTERLRYLFQLASPTRWELEAELASRWVQLGGLRSALEIYERLEMWAEAALCWAATEREDKARKIVRKQLFHPANGQGEDADDDEESWTGEERSPSPADAPRLYCILGDIGQDIHMYERAWEVSNGRYARAQRSLGRHYFALKDFAKAADAYDKSLKANQLNHASWFALGCALLELEQYERAVQAFSRTVQLDESDAEAWSNLAAALLRLELVPDSDLANEYTIRSIADDEDEDIQGVVQKRRDPQQHKKDALKAFKRAATLKYDNFRIWENLLTVAASVVPPSYNDVVVSQKRIIEIRGPTVGEACVDVEILDHLVRDVISMDTENTGYDSTKPGIARMTVELVEKSVVPLITSSRRLWQIVARLALWRNRPTTALEANEKAWRAATNQPGWESGSESRWDEAVDATVELCDAYESLGPRERTEGLGAGGGELVAKDWKFKARSAVRGIMGKGKDGWEGTPGWERLQGVLEDLKGNA
ncbi:hypothetical protein BJ546DRAFT_988358 [Cryomyces antarcticus]